MIEKPTDAMQQFSPGPAGNAGAAGLVLLYADRYRDLPAAWALGRECTLIGSEPTCNVVLPVPAVSRRHAEIAPVGSGWMLRDLRSTNGTLVDGLRASEVRLEHGQEIRLGDAILKFVEHGCSNYAPFRIDGSLLPGTRRNGNPSSPVIGGYQMDHVSSEIERIAESPLSVLLLGESGTGKEVAAHYLHTQSKRRGPFRAVNCAALPHNLLESELFGYRKGAFSGAERDKEGIIQSAHGGTLLLDEIGDMPFEAQAKLLRVLQSKELVPLGATRPEKVDVRVVGATHRDLDQLLATGKFRRDLYARLNEYTLHLPPLRDRKEDLLMLFQEFFKRHGKPELQVSFGFMLGALHYDWPYNVRELESCAKRCIVLAESRQLTEALLPEEVRAAMQNYGKPLLQGEPGATAPASVPTANELSSLLRHHHGNVARVARDLGKARMQVHRWVQRYNLDLQSFRGDRD
jgi:sigma-54 dependent transcriptional regulator, acetoin dehydrogenase operon transcriptional activator AcoR